MTLNPRIIAGQDVHVAMGRRLAADRMLDEVLYWEHDTMTNESVWHLRLNGERGTVPLRTNANLPIEEQLDIVRVALTVGR